MSASGGKADIPRPSRASSRRFSRSLKQAGGFFEEHRERKGDPSGTGHFVIDDITCAAWCRQVDARGPAADDLAASMIASIAGEIEGGALNNRRPFRSPHHSASMPALVGGGLRARPGEISLAHNAVLFLDELPEFSGQVLDSLRQPLETGEVAISRANHRITYPARFMLIAR